MAGKNMTIWLLLGVALALSGCDQLGIDTPAKAAQREGAQARAIGSACRHAVRAIEDCYSLNPKADKAEVFAGWREMDEYMRENKIEGIPPSIAKALPATKASAPEDEAEDEPDEEVVSQEKASGAKRGVPEAG